MIQVAANYKAPPQGSAKNLSPANESKIFLNNPFFINCTRRPHLLIYFIPDDSTLHTCGTSVSTKSCAAPRAYAKR
jgi:hypothetical protein